MRQTGRLGVHFPSKCVGCLPTESRQMAGKRTGVVWDGKKVKCGYCSLTRTDRPGDVRGVARFAGAGVGTQRVEALTVLAQISHHTTLVNVWRETRER